MDNDKTVTQYISNVLDNTNAVVTSFKTFDVINRYLRSIYKLEVNYKNQTKELKLPIQNIYITTTITVAMQYILNKLDIQLDNSESEVTIKFKFQDKSDTVYKTIKYTKDQEVLISDVIVDNNLLEYKINTPLTIVIDIK